MFGCSRFDRWPKIAVGSLIVGSALLLGAKPQEAGKTAGQEAQEVELFAAIEAGQLEARLILQDEFQGKVLFRNKAGVPLDVRLPDVMARVRARAEKRRVWEKSIFLGAPHPFKKKKN